jgi:hypothetical protein
MALCWPAWKGVRHAVWAFQSSVTWAPSELGNAEAAWQPIGRNALRLASTRSSAPFVRGNSTAVA